MNLMKMSHDISSIPITFETSRARISYMPWKFQHNCKDSNIERECVVHSEEFSEAIKSQIH